MANQYLTDFSKLELQTFYSAGFGLVIHAPPTWVQGDDADVFQLKDPATGTEIASSAYQNPQLTPACFIAGTLVHTDQGLVPIEQLKVGDLVLSQPEGGGPLSYKPVAQTFVHEDRPICVMSFSSQMRPQHATGHGPEGADGWFEYFIGVTEEHPFFVRQFGEQEGSWRPVVQISPAASSRVMTHTGDWQKINHCANLYVTNDAGVGWSPADGFTTQGYYFDCAAERMVGERGWYNTGRFDEIDLYGHDYPLRATVYNIEVEDNHTYYVGEVGLWAHNTKIDPRGNVVLSKAQMDTQVTGSQPGRIVYTDEGVIDFSRAPDVFESQLPGFFQNQGRKMVPVLEFDSPWRRAGAQTAPYIAADAQRRMPNGRPSSLLLDGKSQNSTYMKIVDDVDPVVRQNTADKRFLDHLGGVEYVQLADGSTARVTEPSPVYGTTNGAVGWTPLNSRADTGWMLDFRDTPLQTGIEPVYNHGVEWWGPEGRFTTTVYNLEVEDFPTYFAGEIGVWVHSTQGASHADTCSPGEIPGDGFLAGTLVQTQTGLKPVEALSNGAMVLTRHENGNGPDTFKKVTRAFQLPNREVRAIEYVKSGSVTSTYLYATGEQPFWVVGKGWTSVDELLPGNDLLLSDGSTAFIYRKHFVFQSTTEAIGHVIHDVESPGFLLNLSDGRSINDGQEISVSEALNGPQLNSAACHVYNFEMEDGDSCFVGPDGVLVHNKCLALVTKPDSSSKAGLQS